MSSTSYYFEQLNAQLKQHPRAIPRLLVDLDLVDQNIAQCKQQIPAGADFRIVVKSLPSLAFVQYLMKKMGTYKLMVFHQPFLSDLAKSLSAEADILLGKPMPIQTARYFYEHLPERENNFDAFWQIQWLVDTPERLLQYLALAKSLGKKLRINLEIDVGLRRGGFQNLPQLQVALNLLKTHASWLSFSGFMGYDPHVVKIPGLLRSVKKSQRLSNQFYQDCKRLVQVAFPELWQDKLCFNGAGSPTVSLHHNTASPLNDIAAGSLFVKPTSFDIPSLQAYQAACFIATPVLKKMSGTVLPGLEKLKGLLPFLHSRHAQSFFIYGGYWKADYVYPKNLQANALFGPSTNQTMVNAPSKVSLAVDDFVFLRPQQSEFVFLQFGKLMILRGGVIVDQWSLLRND